MNMAKRVQSLTKTPPLSFYVGDKNEKEKVARVLSDTARLLRLSGRSALLRKIGTIDPELLADALKRILRSRADTGIAGCVGKSKAVDS